MSSKVEIANMAIACLGIDRRIADIDTETSKEAINIRLHYDNCLNTIFEDFPWPFAERQEALALVEETPNDRWDFSYRYPANCAKFLRIDNGERVDTEATRIPTSRGSDDDGELIFTDEEDAVAIFTSKITETPRFPANFVNALAYLIASKIAPAVTNNAKNGKDMYGLYWAYAQRAQANALQEETPDIDNEAGSILARN